MGVEQGDIEGGSVDCFGATLVGTQRLGTVSVSVHLGYLLKLM